MLFDKDQISVSEYLKEGKELGVVMNYGIGQEVLNYFIKQIGIQVVDLGLY